MNTFGVITVNDGVVNFLVSNKNGHVYCSRKYMNAIQNSTAIDILSKVKKHKVEQIIVPDNKTKTFVNRLGIENVAIFYKAVGVDGLKPDGAYIEYLYMIQKSSECVSAKFQYKDTYVLARLYAVYLQLDSKDAFKRVVRNLTYLAMYAEDGWLKHNSTSNKVLIHHQRLLLLNRYAGGLDDEK